MAIWIALALAAAALPPDDDVRLPVSLQFEDERPPVRATATARVGAWTGSSFEFQAVRSDSTQATSKQQTFFSASVLGGAVFYDHVVLLATYEASLASKLTIMAGGVYVGVRDHPKPRYGKGVPDEVMLYAGVLLGRVDVDEPEFGNFDRGVGFAGGVELGWSIAEGMVVGLYGEYRNLKFDYQRDILSGDDTLGGSSVWVGLGLDYRF
jgi:hypothetical protein